MSCVIRKKEWDDVNKKLTEVKSRLNEMKDKRCINLEVK